MSTRKAAPDAIRGWTFPDGSTKAHYFLDANEPSLCRRWAVFNPDPNRFSDAHDNHSDNCAACRKALAKIRAKEGRPHGAD